ncbi:bifunctional adenosylcobinamide kinase/adenosylcobinamide-phosphate guanylyltransferase [Amylibacter sp. IMCC11727]|uniref:bifunctional adenosylcobinamide kinase/adenosylcobinamide-phosphate guanylyltransferase n=1 Tax=Amylibacter sp. IMCC11727 TaxID=3039851 RepID=UPI00244DCE7B|nr:bifunctional adenosylcobinamide kinase/adenosylcobinamide-phosphate guanylyltransferase [Amylibacter sp. IMCC11727]WGI21587.1 bifunctional adenosylcobinamide kinase/adenosylcobinamide-phosphate guanylyltransferase [Amylibacter sp. IMCC11727]
MQLPKFTLVLGGAASGKSSFAEKLVIQSGLNRSYLATAQAFDDEMREKIKEHQRDRGENWDTTEVPIELPKAVLDQPNDNIILVDCLTLWLTNLMLSDADCDTAAQAFFDAIRTRNTPIVAVSNEVGHSVIPETSLGRRFQRAQGRLNAQVAAKADLVVMVTAGLPQTLKGTLPSDLS